MIIAIGTTRKSKVEGIKQGINECPYFKTNKNLEFILEKVASDIADMPLTIGETMLGAKNRAKNLINKGIKADYYIGIEGGANKLGDKAYLGGVIYIENSLGEGHYGFSQTIEIPSIIEKRMYNKGEELGPIMDDISNTLDLRSENGAMCAWSENMFTRQEEFSLAFKAAIAPFYNKYYLI